MKRAVWFLSLLVVGFAIGLACCPAKAACLQPPVHSQTWRYDAIECTPTRELVECGCSDWFHWPKIRGAVYYRIERRPDAGPAWSVVGDTRWKNRASYLDEDGFTVPAVHATLWVFYWDVAPATYGQIYEYRIVPIGASGSPVSPVVCDAGPCAGQTITLRTTRWNPSPVRYLGMP